MRVALQRGGASQAAAPTGALAAVDMAETSVEEMQVEPEREERVAKQHASYPTTEVLRSGGTSTGDSATLFVQAEE